MAEMLLQGEIKPYSARPKGLSVGPFLVLRDIFANHDERSEFKRFEKTHLTRRREGAK
jgi:hypothetical protein